MHGNLQSAIGNLKSGNSMSVGDFIRNSQVWKSIFRHPAPRDRRNRVVVMLTNVFLHLHPVSVRRSGIALSYTWCMGGITFFLFLVETVTGVLLMFYYRPTLEHAYNDILALRDVATLGVLRELHRWGAHAMVITVWLRSEEHTSELQSPMYLVCRLLLEKKNKTTSQL